MLRVRYAIALAVIGVFVLAPMHHHRLALDHTPQAAAAKSCSVCLLHGKVAIEVGHSATLLPLSATSFLTVSATGAPRESEAAAFASRAPPAV